MNSNKKLLSILISFAQKQNSPHVSLREFCDYMKRYAQHNLETHPELAPYITHPETTLLPELELLQEKGLTYISNLESDKKSIIIVPHYVDRYASRYTEILNNPSIPFPVLKDLPKIVPLEILKQHQASIFLLELFENEESDDKEEMSKSQEDKKLYSLTFSNNLPTMIYPSTVTAASLFEISLAKLRNILRKEEFFDYFLKRLRVSNTGKEISVKNFFTSFVHKPAEFLDSIKTSSDYYYFWNQLGYFIRQDYEKVNEYTQEHITILQSISIIDIAIDFYKTKSQQNFQRKMALKNLGQALFNPPYYFDKKAIAQLTDNNGIPLISQCSEEVLNEFLVMKTTQAENEELPDLLTFKTYAGERFYICKTNVIPLIIRLCNEARDVVKDTMIRAWFEVYSRYDTVPAMNDQAEFEKSLEIEVRTFSPILEALLEAHFLQLLHYDSQNNSNRILLFSNGKRLPYSELLMLSRREIATDAKILLPFWYSIPLISWIIKFFFNPKKYIAKKKTAQVQTTGMQIKQDDTIDAKKNAEQTKRKEEFRTAAKEAEEKIIPKDSNLEKELHHYEQQWNRILNKKNSNNLTEDVNSYIRDYMRKTIRTIKASTFSVDRMKNLVDNMMSNQNLQKITNKESLKTYILLYIIKILKNL